MDDAKIHQNVQIGGNATIGSCSVIGEPPRGAKPGELKTVVGKDATIRSHSVIYAGNVIGDGFETGHGIMVRENNKIGSDVSVGSHSVIERDCVIGDGARLHSNVFIPEYTKIGNGAWIGPNAVLTNAEFPKSVHAKKFLHGPVIGEGAKIGANATILPGVKVGKNALVGAGSVVTKDVPENSVVVGNPARKTKDVSDLRYRTGEKPY
jgi:acetyltransferase-like isoleucine patch superfamily enzyme